MDRTITDVALAENLSEVLKRVRDHGERFVVERHGRPVAVLGPAPKRVTVRDLLDLVQRIDWPDEEFARDLDTVHRSQPKVEFPEWPC